MRKTLYFRFFWLTLFFNPVKRFYGGHFSIFPFFILWKLSFFGTNKKEKAHTLKFRKELRFGYAPFCQSCVPFVFNSVYCFVNFSIIVHVTGRSKPSFQNATPATSFANTASSFFSRDVSSSSQILYV